MTRWLGVCYRCHRDRMVESRSDHAMQALCDECAATPHQRPKADQHERAERPKRMVVVTPMRGSRYVPVHWLWRPYVPLGKITLLAGLAGQGKSQLTCLLAAMTSRGELDAAAGDVVIVSGEDDPADTIFPRLGAANADSGRLATVDARERLADGSTVATVLSLPDDAQGLTAALEGLDSPRLLILDPVQSFLGGTVNAYRATDVRRALAPLKALAERFSMAVVLVTHLNKTKDAEPLARITDSGAFTALARGVMLLAPDPEDEGGDRGRLKVMALAKSNLADSGEFSLRFRLGSTTVTDDYGTTVEVGTADLYGRSPLNAHDLLIPADQRPALDEARLFLRTELAERWRKATEIQKVAKGLHSEHTLRRAREIECARPRRHDNAWWWGLKGVIWTANGAEGVQGSLPEHQGHLGHLGAQDVQDAQDVGKEGSGHLANGETDHLRFRDAMLGERWEDE